MGDPARPMPNVAHVNKYSLMMFIKVNNLHQKHIQEYNIRQQMAGKGQFLLM